MKLLFFGVFVCMSILAGEPEVSYKCRLSPVPVDPETARIIAGHGSVSGALAGAKLTVTGVFEGLRSPASGASLHLSRVLGVPEVPALPIHELTVSKETAGSIKGSVDLTGSEVEALRKGLLYVVVSSEGAPDGNLWGWLRR